MRQSDRFVNARSLSSQVVTLSLRGVDVPFVALKDPAFLKHRKEPLTYPPIQAPHDRKEVISEPGAAAPSLAESFFPPC